MNDDDDPTHSAHAAGSPYMAPADLARLADNAFDMLCMAAEGRMTAVNRAFETNLGWSAEALTSRPFFDFVHPDDIAATTEAWLQLLRGEQLVDFENRYRHRDGGWRWIQWRAGRLDDGPVHAVARDITVQRRERILIERTHRIARVGGWQLDFGSGRLYWTSGTYRLHEVDPQSFTPDLRRALDFYLPADRARVAAALDALSTHGTPFDLEARVMTASERVIIVRAEGIPIVEGDAIVGAFGAIGDITERRRAERLLRQMESVVRSTPQAVLFISVERRLQWYNAAAGDLLGLDDEALGQPTSSMFSPTTVARIEQQALPLLRTAGSWTGPVELIACDGTLIPGRSTVTLHRDADGRPDFFSASIEDLRSQRQLEQQVRHIQRVEATGRLAGGLAHDFNNLLTVVLANAVELNEALSGTDLSTLAAEIGEAARRGAELTRKLLTYTRQDVARPAAIDLLQVCLDLSRMLRRAFGAWVQIRVDPAAHNWPVHIDPTHLDQLLMNLAMNARDAMPRGGVLSFELTHLPGHAARADRMRLTVADTGCGMAPDVLARATDPFFTTKGSEHGTGLGLATCMGLVEQAGGTLKIESREREGTRVTVELPRASRQLLVPKRTVTSEGPPCAGERVMLIEDEAGIRRVISDGLTRLGYQVEAFGSAEDALDAAQTRSYRPAIVLSDVVLPAMDGPTAAQRMRDVLGPHPVIFASGYADDRLDRAMLDHPAVRFLRKPYTAREAHRLIRELLD